MVRYEKKTISLEVLPNLMINDCAAAGLPKTQLKQQMKLLTKISLSVEISPRASSKFDAFPLYS